MEKDVISTSSMAGSMAGNSGMHAIPVSTDKESPYTDISPYLEKEEMDNALFLLELMIGKNRL